VYSVSTRGKPHSPESEVYLNEQSRGINIVLSRKSHCEAYMIQGDVQANYSISK